jgi:site-specific recombinase XerD
VDPGHVDYPAERAIFISVKPSLRTQGAYRRALVVFEEWLGRKNLALRAVTPVLAADFIKDLRTRGAHDNAVQSIVTACSSFYTFLGRRFPDIGNPFQGAAQARREEHAGKENKYRN